MFLLTFDVTELFSGALANVLAISPIEMTQYRIVSCSWLYQDVTFVSVCSSTDTFIKIMNI